MMSIGFLTEEDSPVIWRGPMLHKALTSFITEVWWDDPDYLLVDLPPGTGDVALSLSGLLPDRVVRDRHDPPARRPARRAPGRRHGRAGQPAGGGVIENMSWFEAPTPAPATRSSPGGGEPLAPSSGCRSSAASRSSRPSRRRATRACRSWRPTPDSAAARALRSAAEERLLAVVPRPALAPS